MQVPVRVLQDFEGAIDRRGLRARLFTRTEDGDAPTMMAEDVARKHEAAGFVELVDAPAEDAGSDDGAAGAYVPDTEDGLPADDASHEDVMSWLGKATGKKLLAWLAKRDVSVPRGSRVDADIRPLALDVARKEAAGLDDGTARVETAVTPETDEAAAQAAAGDGAPLDPGGDPDAQRTTENVTPGIDDEDAGSDDGNGSDEEE